jgi:hypothetical protein
LSTPHRRAPRPVVEFGPFRVGDRLAGNWVIETLTLREVAVELRLHHDAHGVVTLVAEIRSDQPPSPFDIGDTRLSYRRTPVAIADFAGAATDVRSRIAAGGSAAFNALLDGQSTTSMLKASDGWQQILRTMLTGDSRTSVEAIHAFAADALPDIACLLPWIRLEYQPQTFGPCCIDYQTSVAFANPDVSPQQLWHGPVMRAFRKALTGQAPLHSTCRASCPWLSTTGMAARNFTFRGGPSAFVENQIRIFDDLLSRRSDVTGTPLQICFPTTTYCNYDCLMCEYGEIGTLKDEKPMSFYESLKAWLPGAHIIDVLGGEPLASPNFRQFLRTFDFSEFPQLGISMTTNASYLTPSEQAHMKHVPFLSLNVSLNAATPDSYRKVNRGLEFGRIRENLDALLERKDAIGITYSMVLLKANHHEIRAFAQLAADDGVGVRYMLPMRNRNDESILTDPSAMKASVEALEEVETDLAVRDERAANALRGELNVLRTRLAQRVFRPLPDGSPLH